jgi:hypothetical protein
VSPGTVVARELSCPAVATASLATVRGMVVVDSWFLKERGMERRVVSVWRIRKATSALFEIVSIPTLARIDYEKSS